eukprot:SM016865S02571  [mRNA]  locus=s16865:36:140:- [translate_table: standard]
MAPRSAASASPLGRASELVMTDLASLRHRRRASQC